MSIFPGIERLAMEHLIDTSIFDVWSCHETTTITTNLGGYE